MSQKTWNYLRRWLREGTRPPGRPGGKGGQGAGGRQKKLKKIKLMDSGVSHQVKQGYDIKRPCSAVHLTTLLHHDLLQRS